MVVGSKKDPRCFRYLQYPTTLLLRRWSDPNWLFLLEEASCTPPPSFYDGGRILECERVWYSRNRSSGSMIYSFGKPQNMVPVRGTSIRSRRIWVLFEKNRDSVRKQDISLSNPSIQGTNLAESIQGEGEGVKLSGFLSFFIYSESSSEDFLPRSRIKFKKESEPA